MTGALSSILCLSALALSHAALGQNLTIDDPGEEVTLALPPGSAIAPAEQLLSTASGVNEAASAIPILALDSTVQGRVVLVRIAREIQSWQCCYSSAYATFLPHLWSWLL